MSTEGRAPARVGRRLPHAFPFLLAINSVTLLVVSNPGEGIVYANLKAPLLLAVFMCLVAWAVSALFVRDRLRRSLATTAIVLPLLLSGYLSAPLPEHVLKSGGGPVLEVGVTFLLMCLALFLIHRRNWSGGEARFLTLFSVFLLLISLPALGRVASKPRLPTLADTPLPDTVDLHRPDIYFVVLDAYTGSKALRENYAFDNGLFTDFLETRGFGLPEDFHSNYIKTFLSLTSMLNRDYLDDLVAAGRATDRTAALARMEFNRTVVDLKRLGYRFSYAGSSYPPLAMNGLADEQYSAVPSHAFERLYFGLTVLAPALSICRSVGLCAVPDLPFEAEAAEETNARVSYLESLIDRPGPKFVFAHWLLPHGPYRFGADCRLREARWISHRGAVEEDSTLRRLYIDQLRCTNRKLEVLVDSMLTASSTPPVIILQADHGNGRFVGDVPTDLAEARPDQVEERFDAFGAYFGPGGVGDSLAAQRSPVNVFRTLFRVLWAVDEPPLEDRSYWSDREQPMALQEVEIHRNGADLRR